MGEFADIVGQVDIFRKSADGVVGFRERCAAFEDEVVTERRPVKGLKCPDDQASFSRRWIGRPAFSSAIARTSLRSSRDSCKNCSAIGSLSYTAGKPAGKLRGGSDEFAERLGGKLPLNARKCLFRPFRTKPCQRADSHAGRLFAKASCQRGTCFNSIVWLPTVMVRLRPDVR